MVSQAASRRNVTVVLQDGVAAQAMNHLTTRSSRATQPDRRPLAVWPRDRIAPDRRPGPDGRLVEALSPDYGFQVAGTVDIDNAAQHDAWPQADVAIDFSLADAVP